MYAGLLGVIGFLAPLTIICVLGIIYSDELETFARKLLGKPKKHS